MINTLTPVNIFIAIGANLVPEGYDDLHEALEDAVGQLCDTPLDLLARSDWYVTKAVPASDQPNFLNAVLSMTSQLNARETLAILHHVENSFGRQRAFVDEARVLDLDLLAYDKLIVNEPDIIVPHPRLSQRSFVLMPWAQIAPDWMHPFFKLTVAEMLDALPAADKVPPAIEAWQQRS